MVAPRKNHARKIVYTNPSSGIYFTTCEPTSRTVLVLTSSFQMKPITISVSSGILSCLRTETQSESKAETELSVLLDLYRAARLSFMQLCKKKKKPSTH